MTIGGWCILGLAHIIGYTLNIMVKLYSRENRYWHRNPVTAFMGYLRDVILQLIPFKLPAILIRLLYGVKADFIFLVHPRQSEDIYRALPFLTILRRQMSKKGTLKIFKYCPPCVIGAIKTSRGVNGLVLSSFYLPEVLLSNRKSTLKEAYRCISFAGKVLPSEAYIGLGAWWPIVTRRGRALAKRAGKKQLNITSGHTGTLISLVLSIRKIAQLAGVGMEDMKIAIIGAGKMGSNLGKVLAKEVKSLALIDINSKRIGRLEKELKRINEEIVIEKIVRTSTTDLKQKLNKYDLAVCVASNANRILDERDIPDNFIIIDDSRPEAVSREGMTDSRLILEGGLIKISGSRGSYNYGFGIDNNVFGCLAETYALALSGMSGLGGLEPTLGDIDLESYKVMLDFFKTNGLEIGDFKSGERKIGIEEITEIMRQRFNSNKQGSKTDVQR